MEQQMKDDFFYMKRALELAEYGRGHTNPNPVVGAVIVNEGKIVGEGYHACYGELHAERNAIADCYVKAGDVKVARQQLKGSTIYVTLEPCCHYGKTPPCTEAIIEHQIARVVVGAKDPNPLVGGKGIEVLREHGIEVIEGVLTEECYRANEIFFHYIQHKTPYVLMKYAMTLDGKIATRTGESKWITGEKARAHVQKLRSEYMGIMVGIGTVLQDDPMLNCRVEGARQPIRIVCDTRLRIPLTSKLVQSAREYPLIIATGVKDPARIMEYESLGCEVLPVPIDGNKISLNALMKQLGEKGIDSILLEGGGQMHWAALEAGIVQKINAYIAPVLFGGQNAKTPIGGEGVLRPVDGIRLNNMQWKQIGEDWMLEGTFASK